jgi:NTE family protein
MKDFIRKFTGKLIKKKIGLALGGGGLRAFSMFPILTQINNLDIKISYVSGTSAGSILGAYYCLYGEVDSLYNEFSNYKKKDWLKLFDLSYKIGKPIIKGEKIKKMLDSIFDNKTFDDLKIPLIVTATNLDSGEIEYISKGKIIDAVMASISYPVIMPPYEMNNQHYVDGGLLDVLPLDILFKKKVNRVIAINLFNIEKQKVINYSNIFNLLSRSFEIVFLESFKRSLSEKRKIFIFSPLIKKSLTGIWDIRDIDKHYISGKNEWDNKKTELVDWLKK